ncbi:hypothetical protein HCY87_04585 [Limosilactobacillus fermentum]
MTEQNKKNSRLQLNEGTISVDAESIVSIDAESIVFKPQAFKACDDQQNLDSSANQEQGLQNHLGN